MNGYRGILNRIAYNQLTLSPDIPDFKLMVGSAENLNPLPTLIYRDYYGEQAKALIEPMKNLKAEQVDPQLVGITYTPDDFVNNTIFLGDPVAGGGQ